MGGRRRIGDRTVGYVRASIETEYQANPVLVRSGCDAERNEVAKSSISHCQEKPLARDQVPVPQTDTGSQDENSKVSERTLVKELGKMTP